jgi:hypothetical protein
LHWRGRADSCDRRGHGHGWLSCRCRLWGECRSTKDRTRSGAKLDDLAAIGPSARAKVLWEPPARSFAQSSLAGGI